MCLTKEKLAITEKMKTLPEVGNKVNK